MFRASSCPSSGATTTAVAASGLPSELGDSSAVCRGRPDHFFNNSNTNEDTATKFEQEYVLFFHMFYTMR